MPSQIPFLDLIKKRTVLFDGAMGTTLIANGLTAGESPEGWNISRPDVIAGIHEAYARAGVDVLQTNTLGGTGMKLKLAGLGENAREANVQAVRLARQACPEHGYVAGDIGPTGQFLPPVGNTSPEDMAATFREQAGYLAAEGVDLFVIETFYDLQEILLAITAARSAADLPVVATLSFERKPKGFATIMGNSVPDAAELMAAAGADVVGTNCNLGSADMADFTPLWRTATDLPILVQPNAGQPLVVDGQLTYQQEASAFAEDIVRIARAGADAVGGCCGTTPEWLTLIRDRLKEEGFFEGRDRHE
jgi:methionine synthase I (cobalamin-dependent)